MALCASVLVHILSCNEVRETRCSYSAALRFVATTRQTSEMSVVTQHACVCTRTTVSSISCLCMCVSLFVCSMLDGVCDAFALSFIDLLLCTSRSLLAHLHGFVIANKVHKVTSHERSSCIVGNVSARFSTRKKTI